MPVSLLLGWPSTVASWPSALLNTIIQENYSFVYKKWNAIEINKNLTREDIQIFI